MSFVYKDINPGDKSVQQYLAHKTWTVTDETTGSYGIKVFQAVSSSVEYYTDNPNAPWRDGGWKTPGLTGEGTQYQTLVWRWLHNVFYAPHKYPKNPPNMGPTDWIIVDNMVPTLASRNGLNVDPTGQVIVPPSPKADIYNLSQSLTTAGAQSPYFTDNTQVTSLQKSASVMMIPHKVCGYRIKPGSIEIVSSGTTLTDRGGFLYRSVGNISNQKVGDVFYEMGAIVITANHNNLQNTFDNFTMTFKGSHPITEHEYRCVVSENDFLVSANPSLLGRPNIVKGPSGLTSGIEIDFQFNGVEDYLFSDNPHEDTNHGVSGSMFGAGIRAQENATIEVSASNPGRNFLVIKNQASTNHNVIVPLELEANRVYNIEFDHFDNGEELIVSLQTPQGQSGNSGQLFSKAMPTAGQLTSQHIGFTSSLKGAYELQFGINEPGGGGTSSIDDLRVWEQTEGQGFSPGGKIVGFATHSEFSPYITTVGLYNSENVCMAVGKLPRAIKNPKDYDISFVLRFDS